MDRIRRAAEEYAEAWLATERRRHATHIGTQTWVRRCQLCNPMPWAPPKPETPTPRQLRDTVNKPWDVEG
jgi:hypothetical protein